MMVQFRAMVLSPAGNALFGAGWKDSVRIYENNPYRDRDSVLVVISAADGETIKEYPLEAGPVFDGLSAAYGRLYLSMKNGRVLCMAGK